MLQGGIPDLDAELQPRFSAGRTQEMPTRCTTARPNICWSTKRSCAKGWLPYALIFEDDIFLTRKLDRMFDAALREMGQQHGASEPFLVGFEATCMGFVPRSQRIEGRGAYSGRFCSARALTW